MKVVTLPGDGIGPDVMREAVRALEHVAPTLTFSEHLIGGHALEEDGRPLPAATLAACRAADAVLMGAVGTDAMVWDGRSPEDGMFALRRQLGVYANLRPSVTPEFDLLIVRELLGGLYYGQQGTREDGTVFDTLEYRPSEVERVVRRAFELARSRRGFMTSVDKANVLLTSRMWRRVVHEMAVEFPEVEVSHLLVDTAAMRLVDRPTAFDVIVTENMFGDVLSDIAAAVSGGLGGAASACLGDARPGLFEPVHGSAPDIAGQGIANPTAMIRSAVLMLNYGLEMPDEARRLEAALERAIPLAPTPDVGGTHTTSSFGDTLLEQLAYSTEADRV